MTASTVKIEDEVPADVREQMDAAQRLQDLKSQMTHIGVTDSDTYLPDQARPAEMLHAQAAAIEESKFRTFTIKVPVGVPDQSIMTAVRIGQEAYTGAMNSMMTIVFPTRQKLDDGRIVPALGKVTVPLMDESDINRIIDLAKAIRGANEKIMNASNPGDKLAATIGAKKQKDNATRQAVGKAEGLGGGIIVP
jgi:hypothetical protein